MDACYVDELARDLAAAKSRQDMTAALRLLHHEVELQGQSGVSTDAVRRTLFGAGA